jgi:hypothetical protein
MDKEGQNINVNTTVSDESMMSTEDINLNPNIEKQEVVVTIGKEQFFSQIYLTRIFKIPYKKVGKMYAFWFDKEGVPRIVIGPHCKNKILLLITPTHI